MYTYIYTVYIVTDLINTLPGNRSVNTAQQATIEEAVFSVDPTDAPIDWLDSDHVICVHCKSMFILRLYKGVTEFVQGSYELRVYESVIRLRSSRGFLVEFEVPGWLNRKCKEDIIVI
jgi:hypothetical protein